MLEELKGSTCADFWHYAKQQLKHHVGGIVPAYVVELPDVAAADMLVLYALHVLYCMYNIHCMYHRCYTQSTHCMHVMQYMHCVYNMRYASTAHGLCHQITIEHLVLVVRLTSLHLKITQNVCAGWELNCQPPSSSLRT